MNKIIDNEQAYLDTEMKLRDREEDIELGELEEEPTLPGEDDELDND